MESIKMVYTFTNDEGEVEKKIIDRKVAESGLIDSDVCEMFEDFMEAVGFSIDNVYQYFNE